MPEPATGPAHEDARGRLRRAVTRPSRGQAVVGALLALVGFAVVTQVRTNTVDDTYAGLREQDLIDILDGLAGSTQRAEAEVQRLEEARDSLTSTTQQRQTALDEARSQVEVLSVLAGTVPVSGPGVTVRIEEDAEQVDLGSFIDLVQALRSAGAETLAVNHEVRVVAQTSFGVGPGGLYVDGQLVEPPYVVDAIGNPDALVAALRFPDGPQDAFTRDGAELTFEEVSTMRVNAVARASTAESAEPR